MNKLAPAKKLHIREPHDQQHWFAILRNDMRPAKFTTTGHVALDQKMRLPHAPLKDRFMAVIIEAEDAPKECQLCDSAITTEYVDGVVAGQGWANMCVHCHKKYGTGLGTGLGQLYRLDAERKLYIKIEG